MYNEKEVLAAMGDCLFVPHLHLLEEVDSTNLYLKALAAEGAPEGTAALAQMQTAGRGRLGRTFQSPPAGGVYVSVLLRPRFTAQEATLLTACAGVCVCEAIEEVCGLSPSIKWVNDLLLGGKKICGILTESALSPSGAPAWLVLGMGVNANTDVSAFPPAVREVATSLLAEGGRRVCVEKLAGAILRQVAAFYTGFPGNLPRLHRRYCQRLGSPRGSVTILGDASGTQYTVLGVDEQFGLTVRDPAGCLRTLRSGEVSVRPAAT